MPIFLFEEMFEQKVEVRKTYLINSRLSYFHTSECTSTGKSGIASFQPSRCQSLYRRRATLLPPVFVPLWLLMITSRKEPTWPNYIYFPIILFAFLCRLNFSIFCSATASQRVSEGRSWCDANIYVLCQRGQVGKSRSHSGKDWGKHDHVIFYDPPNGCESLLSTSFLSIMGRLRLESSLAKLFNKCTYFQKSGDLNKTNKQTNKQTNHQK